MERFHLDDIQAQAVCDMRLIALQGLNREKLEAEYKELEERIAYYNQLLASEEMIVLNNQQTFQQVGPLLGFAQVVLGAADDNLLLIGNILIQNVPQPKRPQGGTHRHPGQIWR